MTTPTSTKLTFRPATDDDAPALEQLINTAFRADNTTQVFLSPQHRDSVDVTSAAAIRAAIAKPDVAVFVGVDSASSSADDSKLMAHCSVRRLDDNEEKKKKRTAWFGLLAVDLASQGRGLGSQVLAFAERYVVDNWGSERMEFGVVNTRAELRAWYGKRGYLPTGETGAFPYEMHGEWEGVLREGLEFVTLGKDLDG